MREHGGNIDVASAKYGFAPDDMLDLSTGISPIMYPLPPIKVDALQPLPTAATLDACVTAARHAYGVPEQLAVTAGAGTQAFLQLIPHLVKTGTVWIRQPTYNEHAHCWADAGHHIVDGNVMPDAADYAVVVFPNNPTGDKYGDLVGLALDIEAKGGLLIIDGAFLDNEEGANILADLSPFSRVIHLRSFGKFFGLAGVRLGFAMASQMLSDSLTEMLGPWAVNNVALIAGTKALQDQTWIKAHKDTLERQSAELAKVLANANLEIIGGTSLFQTIRDVDALSLHTHLAKTGIWTRMYREWPDLMRFGLPRDSDEMDRLCNSITIWRR
ncbi:MAG: pyridoxal phosphate-dependent class II aminotransferase [Candidatus Puniceispirillum sp.]|jgi:cobalamin biosynthesis protein CobC|uniref:threonine-phosphate decarboxylase n=1 Tax=Candidatus Puniceispirillum sp. TaxID=2026719 RepID=UPI001ED1C18B|nr:pyridoxal phosphate-dependent class II aminotransferase [Candidatus Puniceispirillum sp.]MBT6416067.1 pyridoxal phosphate-dependent class II aminotransferase [Candidatus Puniceispirillum sp.]MBT6567261.1 pyridoxal phosphate-dependent class II aminotransferase [Candidatus Puniceispirillum sp.]